MSVCAAGKARSSANGCRKSHCTAAEGCARIAPIALSPAFRPLHTHDSSGRIHLEFKEEGVEAPLEAFFDIWGKHMDSTGFDDHRIDASHEFLMFVTEDNGEGERTQVSTFEDHIVKDGQLIELVYRAIE